MCTALVYVCVFQELLEAVQAVQTDVTRLQLRSSSEYHYCAPALCVELAEGHQYELHVVTTAALCSSTSAIL
jgi:hypothetical protein